MNWFLPLLILVCGILFLFRAKNSTEAFLRGARQGLKSVFALFPTLLLFVTATELFRASGAADMLSDMFAPVCRLLHIPTELDVLLLTRPVSGSASTAVLSDLFETYGPDSYIGLCASVLAGSSETMLYVLSVYAAGDRMKKMPRVFCAAFLTALFVTAASLAVSSWLFA